MLETAGSSGKTLRAGFIRAASDPAYINDDISQIKVSAFFINRTIDINMAFYRVYFL